MLTATNTDYYESGFPKAISRQTLKLPLNKRLRYAREKKGFTLARSTKELNRAGITCAISTLQSYEAPEESMNRRYPSLKMLISLANLYDCSTDYLLGISDEINRYTCDLQILMNRNLHLEWRKEPIDKVQLDMINKKMDQIMEI
jgi:transcriptional regulator with XRE-family HTH domain